MIRQYRLSSVRNFEVVSAPVSEENPSGLWLMSVLAKSEESVGHGVGE